MEPIKSCTTFSSLEVEGCTTKLQFHAAVVVSLTISHKFLRHFGASIGALWLSVCEYHWQMRSLLRTIAIYLNYRAWNFNYSLCSPNNGNIWVFEQIYVLHAASRVSVHVNLSFISQSSVRGFGADKSWTDLSHDGTYRDGSVTFQTSSWVSPFAKRTDWLGRYEFQTFYFLPKGLHTSLFLRF